MAGLDHWSVADFKALTDARLDVAPLTVLTGPNSSGKSSVFQSLLMLGQTVSSRGDVVLNGPLVRLGEPDDVIRDGQSAIRLGFGTTDQAVSWQSKRPRNEIRLALTVDGGADRLVVAHFEMIDLRDDAVLVAATTNRRSKSDFDLLTSRFGSHVNVLRLTNVPDGATPNRAYLVMSGVVPIGLAFHRSSNEIERLYADALDAELSERASFEVFQELSRLVPKEAYSRLRGLETNDRLNVTAPERWTTRNIAALNREERDALVREAAIRRSQDEWITISIDSYSLAFATAAGFNHRLRSEGLLEAVLSVEFDNLLSSIISANRAVTKFGKEIRYLGPLRDEPRVVHQAWDQSDAALPVGIKGELTAEVLTRRRDDRITFNDWNRRRHQLSVPDAVAMWCDYLGIGDHIKILDLKKLGRGVQLRVGGTHRDLTTIGVGASQLLPVIVAGLTVPLGTTLLIEQPELHLHPKVQSRLADFFLFARPGVRFMVETHSEYLITRLRLRVAQERAIPTSLQVLFAEQTDGSTQLRRLNLDKLGDLSAWPVGFFDSSEIDGAEIVRAVAERTRPSGLAEFE